MSTQLITRAEQGDYQKLFIQDLNWSRPDHPPVTQDYNGRTVTATNVSSYKGLRVWIVYEEPDSKLEAAIDQKIAKTSTDRLVIFHHTAQQVWRWPVRRNSGDTTSTRLSRHKHRTGTHDSKFAEKLDVITLPKDAALDSNTVLARLRQAFDVETRNETRHASKLMARLYTSMETAYPHDADPEERDHQISVTLARILFLMFGDDTDMWPPDHFQNFVRDRTAPDGSDIGTQLTKLFNYLDTNPDNRGEIYPDVYGFRYVNGRIFREHLTLPVINAEFRNAVLEACDRDWASISPAIFGSMFQSVRDAITRRQLGEHYTSEDNILKTLRPLFLDDLHAELNHIKTLGKYEASRLRSFREKLGHIRYLDPACGCGNFIIVAYRELRDLELAVLERLQSLPSGERTTQFRANDGLKVTLDHFYGIEIDEWPARIAETAMFLVDRQCDLRLTATLGSAPDRLPIQEQATIVVGNALSMDWAQVVPVTKDVIIAGNPPFIGTKERTAKQTADLRIVWGTRYNGFLDYVTGWYIKTIDYFEGVSGAWAFVSTNSISQGQAVPSLWGSIFGTGWKIKFAHRTFPWTSESTGGAAVHCVIVGFTRSNETRPLLIEYQKGVAKQQRVDSINAYLVDGPNLLVEKRMHPLSPDLPAVHAGSKAVDWGFLTVEGDEYAKFAADPIAAESLRPYKGGTELINNLDRWCLWFVDRTLDELIKSPLVRDRLAEVERRRSLSLKPATKLGSKTPHLFEEQRQPKIAYVGIPQTFTDNREYATVARLGPEVIASIKLFTSPDPDGYLFAVISSSMFMTWQRTVGGRFKSDPSFTNTIVWNTLPLPMVTEQDRARIIRAGCEILTARQLVPTNSLGQHYDPERMTPELNAAHRALDVLVDRAFGAARTCKSERERQRILFARYDELTSALPL